MKHIAAARHGAVVKGDCYRFTILTPHMIRLEYNEQGVFEDRQTQVVLNRDFEVPHYTVVDEPGKLEIITDYVHIIYTKEKFQKNSLSIRMAGELSGFREVWYYGDTLKGNLKGTARTLDEADGDIPLEDGLLSRTGYSIIDDSKSLVLTEAGWVDVRPKEIEDFYFFGYGNRYIQCLQEFYQLTGETPLVPRYALGNWWSRYYRYTEEEYKELMTRFEAEKVPFSVAVIDMDWHLVQIDPKYGSGWTGYTWNKELFPDPKAFMGWLHDKHMQVTLNLHPAEGIKAHEEMYVPMAKALGVDFEQELPIQFDIADPNFMDAYFKYLHHPQEDDGVDFWWIDWQQGNTSKIEGLDPLWMLNHYHYHDIARHGKRPMIFSRYAGPGSHRYPVGFSGDTIVTWESLAFQPYFTAAASNIGYTWWSHDIGGHMGGFKDDEMATRWVQFGVFSPIMRLHSSCSPFTGKEPWKYNKQSENIMKDYMRLRHALVPYTYTMNYASHTQGLPLVQPMYYKYAHQNIAYKVPNQYYYGSELIVCPITEPMDKALGLSKVKAWLPEGQWIDIFSGRVYEGDRCLTLYRELDHIPVFAKAGGILPMADLTHYTNSVENPEQLSIQVFGGAKGCFTLYEDDGISNAYKQGASVQTQLTFNWGENISFNIAPAVGDTTLIPKTRDYQIVFRAIEGIEAVTVTADGKAVAYEYRYDEVLDGFVVVVKACAITQAICVTLQGQVKLAKNDVVQQVFAFLNKAQIEFRIKHKVYALIQKQQHQLAKFVGDLHTLELDDTLREAIEEIVLA